MLSYNYNVANQTDRAGTSTGADIYRSSFSTVGETNYVWGERPRSLNDILKEESLPLVVKLFHENTIKDSESPVDLQRPLLLYKEVKARKLHARNLKSRDISKEQKVIYQAVGPYVTLPENYQGYFQTLDVRSQPLFSIADIARLMPKSFISRTDSPGYACISPLQDSVYLKTTLPGNVYKPESVLEDTINYINKRKSDKKKLVRCLRCEDERGKFVLFPLKNKGEFFVNGQGAKFGKQGNLMPLYDLCSVYKWTDFEQSLLKGLRVKLMHGEGPKEECQFTGILEFDHVIEEHTVIGCTMTSSPRLFEMTVTSEPFFIVALDSDNSSRGSLENQSLKFTKNACDTYMQGIKVKKDYDIEEAESQ